MNTDARSDLEKSFDNNFHNMTVVELEKLIRILKSERDCHAQNAHNLQKAYNNVLKEAKPLIEKIGTTGVGCTDVIIAAQKFLDMWCWNTKSKEP